MSTTATLPSEPVTAPLMNGEKLYSPTAAAKASNVPGHRGGTHLNGSTIFRHITKGVRAANGQVVRLEAVRFGSRWLTSLEAVARFCARLTEASAPSDAPPAARPPTPAATSRAAQNASKTLDTKLGAKR